MTFLQFLILGLGLGGAYALSGQGLVLVYRGSGVINFAQGGVGAAAAFFFYEMHSEHSHFSVALAMVLAVLASGIFGGLVYLIVMRPLRDASPIVRVVATLAVLAIVQAIVTIRYAGQIVIAPSFYPQHVVHFGSKIAVGDDHLILLGAAFAVTAFLWLLYRKSLFGLATSAVAESERAASSLAWSPDFIAGANWVLGSALGGLAGILLFPIATLSVTSITNVVLAALAAALVGRFESFGLTLAAGLSVGVAESLLGQYTHVPGLPRSVPLFIIFIWLIVGGSALPVRGSVLQRLPDLGTGRINWPFTGIAIVGGIVLIVELPFNWTVGATNTIAYALIVLSIVVVSGYAGQISLGQFALAGVGAFIAGRLMAAAGVPFVLAFIIGIVGAVPVGVILALPAARLRGLNLAIVTLGIGLVIQLMVFSNPDYVGGFVGTNIGEHRSLFGYSVDPIAHPKRWAIFAFVIFIIAAFAVAKLRRGAGGGRLIAVRTNERAAASLGIEVTRAKLTAFAIGSALAATGGVLLAFSSTNINYATQFDYSQSYLLMSYAVIGGLGYVSGSFVGALLAPGAIGAVISLELFTGDKVTLYIPLVGGVLLLVVLLTAPAGVAGQNADLYRQIVKRLRGTPPAETVDLSSDEDDHVVRPPAARRELRAFGLTVRFGGIVALEDVGFTVRTGEILGIIGPNGAGKTTLIDAVTGFNHAEGTIELDGRPLHGHSAANRARQGLTRSFQSLELFDDVSVYENLRIAGQQSAGHRRFRPWAGDAGLSAGAVAAIRTFGLGSELSALARDLPYGRRRLVAIARALATSPSVVLLDEPAAGLDSREAEELRVLVARLAQEWGIAFVVVEHNMDFVMNLCDRVVVLDFGHKIAEGTAEEVRADPTVRRAYLGGTESQESDGESAVAAR